MSGIHVRLRPYQRDPSRYQADVWCTLPGAQLPRQRWVVPRQHCSGRDAERRAERWAIQRAQRLIGERAGLTAPAEPQSEPTPADGMTLADIYDAYWREHVAHLQPQTQLNIHSIYKNHIAPEFGKMPLTQISRYRIRQWIQRQQKQSSPATVQLRIARLSGLLKFATEFEIADGITALDTMPAIPRPRNQRARALPANKYFSETESDALLEHARDPVIRAALLLGLDAGLRFGEIVGLQWRDIDLERDQPFIRVERQKYNTCKLGPPKNDGRRVVPITSDLVDALRALPATADAKAFVIPYYQRKLYNALKRLKARAGIPSDRRSWHALRHSYASVLAHETGSPLTVRDTLGHRSLDTTMIYIHGTHSEGAAAALSRRRRERAKNHKGRRTDKVHIF